VTDRDAAVSALGDLLAFLPSHNDDEPPRWFSDDPVDRPTPDAGTLVPSSPTGGYDVRAVIRAVVDDGDLLELRAGWAPNLVTALATIGGRPVGVVANQPVSIAGTLDIPASQKGARFVGFCDAFNLPLLTLVDTPGFYPGKDLEWRGMIRHGAQLAFAYARATVPRIAVALRKAYGGAYIVMDSSHMGNDLYLAWPTAEIAVMGAKGAVEILHRRESPERRAELEADYDAEFLNPYRAAERGSVDAVIDPADTRRTVAAALELLASKQERLVRRKHDNTPL
jgi:acetyl-CoA carboxylase carboxyltransferase component